MLERRACNQPDQGFCSRWRHTFNFRWKSHKAAHSASLFSSRSSLASMHSSSCSSQVLPVASNAASKHEIQPYLSQSILLLFFFLRALSRSRASCSVKSVLFPFGSMLIIPIPTPFEGRKHCKHFLPFCLRRWRLREFQLPEVVHTVAEASPRDRFEGNGGWIRHRWWLLQPAAGGSKLQCCSSQYPRAAFAANGFGISGDPSDSF